MIEIPLTQGKVAFIDDADFVLVGQYRWQAIRGGNNLWYAKHSVSGDKAILMHRMLLNAPPDKRVDHIDHNGVNNQRANMRLCSHQQNMFNMRAGRGSSLYRGVYFDKESGKWTSQVTFDYKRIKIGRFKSELDAAIAYNEAATMYFGEFAVLNSV